MSRKLKQFAIYMPRDMYERLRREAYRRRTNMSAIIRSAITNYLNGAPAAAERGEEG